MNIKIILRIFPLLLALLIAFITMFFIEKNKSNEYKTQLENKFSSSLYELDSRINNIKTILDKTLYLNASTKLSALATELFTEAELAKYALSNLPCEQGGQETLNRFLSQVGNYALSVSESALTNGEISKEQYKNLEMLSVTADKISNAVANTQISINNPEYWSKEIDNKLGEGVESETLATSLEHLEENLTDYPTLIYDGPYSDHILSKQPLFVSNLDEIKREEARVYAAFAANIKSDELRYDGIENGKIECFRFINDSVSVSVSKKGGYIVYMKKENSFSQSSFSYEQALLKAKVFLEKNRYKNMIDTYYFAQDGVCIINFAYLSGQTVCYTDLIKVGVDLSSGEIVFFESSGFLVNHTERVFEKTKYSLEDAKEKINDNIEIINSRLTLIPSDGGAEIRCYEFLCKDANKKEILIYIDVLDLDIEQIFILLKTDGGTLVK